MSVHRNGLLMEAAMGEQAKPEMRQPDESDAVARRELRRWRSEELLGESKEALIMHGDEVYRLLRTRNDKLILVK